MSFSVNSHSVSIEVPKTWSLPKKRAIVETFGYEELLSNFFYEVYSLLRLPTSTQFRFIIPEINFHYNPFSDFLWLGLFNLKDSLRTHFIRLFIASIVHVAFLFPKVKYVKLVLLPLDDPNSIVEKSVLIEPTSSHFVYYRGLYFDFFHLLSVTFTSGLTGDEIKEKLSSSFEFMCSMAVIKGTAFSNIDSYLVNSIYEFYLAVSVACDANSKEDHYSIYDISNYLV